MTGVTTQPEPSNVPEHLKNAGYSSSPTHGYHLHENDDRPQCREYVIGECVLAARGAGAPLDVERLAVLLADPEHFGLLEEWLFGQGPWA